MGLVFVYYQNKLIKLPIIFTIKMQLSICINYIDPAVVGQIKPLNFEEFNSEKYPNP